MAKKLIKQVYNIGFKKLQIIQSNAITRSAQGLTLVEKRILMSALAQTGGIAKPVKIYAKDYADTFNLKNIDNAYQELLYGSKNFLTKYFTLPSITEKGNPSKISFTWLSYVHYSKTEAFIEIRFNQEIYHLLFELTENFTKYKLEQASALRSLYSWRLLELFESVRKNLITKQDKDGNTLKTKKNIDGWLKINIDEFHHAMETTKTHKRSFAELDRKVIKPAIKELQLKDNWIINYRTIKKGRKVAMLEFNFKKNPQLNLFD